LHNHVVAGTFANILGESLPVFHQHVEVCRLSPQSGHVDFVGRRQLHE